MKTVLLRPGLGQGPRPFCSWRCRHSSGRSVLPAWSRGEFRESCSDHSTGGDPPAPAVGPAGTEARRSEPLTPQWVGARLDGLMEHHGGVSERPDHTQKAVGFQKSETRSVCRSEGQERRAGRAKAAGRVLAAGCRPGLA